MAISNYSRERLRQALNNEKLWRELLTCLDDLESATAVSAPGWYREDIFWLPGQTVNNRFIPPFPVGFVDSFSIWVDVVPSSAAGVITLDFWNITQAASMIGGVVDLETLSIGENLVPWALTAVGAHDEVELRLVSTNADMAAGAIEVRAPFIGS